jgi:formylglycine-generating enzyme required for sulfatase activity
MGKYDVTVGQYCQFLNAVAANDTYGLYNSHMALGGYIGYYPTIGITQSGRPGSYGYSVTGSYSQGVNCPIFEVSWGDAARFCNWLQNGQPTGPECGTTTENGAYTLNGATSQLALMGITRNAGAIDVIPTENEWYKAAYYKGGGTNAGYWTYPTQSNTAPINTLPDTGNHANFYDYFETGNGGYTDPVNLETVVGAFADSPGAYGTFDMGGDVWQWDEANIAGLWRVLRGGTWGDGRSDLLASSVRGNDYPTSENVCIGFRVASLAVPEPASIMLLIAGGLCLLAYAWRRRHV